MSGEWKPGDVAMIRTSEHGELVGIRTYSPERGGKHEFFNVAGFSYATDAQLRPLVVIDPEDREQVERLRDLFDAAWIEHNGYSMERAFKGQRGNAMQSALRSIITPPKPEEPTGLGAVVEDERGDLYVRAPMRDGVVWRGTGTWVYKDWATIAVVKVLSVGVTDAEVGA